MSDENMAELLSDKSEIAEQICEILERDSRRYSGFRETEAEAR